MAHVRIIIDVEWGDEEVYFTVEGEDGRVGKVQLNMRNIIDDYNHYIEWEEEEE